MSKIIDIAIREGEHLQLGTTPADIASTPGLENYQFNAAQLQSAIFAAGELVANHPEIDTSLNQLAAEILAASYIQGWTPGTTQPLTQNIDFSTLSQDQINMFTPYIQEQNGAALTALAQAYSSVHFAPLKGDLTIETQAGTLISLQKTEDGSIVIMEQAGTMLASALHPLITDMEYIAAGTPLPNDALTMLQEHYGLNEYQANSLLENERDISANSEIPFLNTSLAAETAPERLSIQRDGNDLTILSTPSSSLNAATSTLSASPEELKEILDFLIGPTAYGLKTNIDQMINNSAIVETGVSTPITAGKLFFELKEDGQVTLYKFNEDGSHNSLTTTPETATQILDLAGTQTAPLIQRLGEELAKITRGSDLAASPAPVIFQGLGSP